MSKRVMYATTILRPRDEVYALWRDWQSLPRFSRHLKSVEDLGNGRTRWTAEGPNGDVTWEAETTADEPGRRIAWRSLPDSEVRNWGEVEFRDAPKDRGTEVYVDMAYDAPGGPLGVLIAKATGNEPEQEVGETLRRFKALLECGELPIVEGQPSNQMRGENQPGDLSKKVGLR